MRTAESRRRSFFERIAHLERALTFAGARSDTLTAGSEELIARCHKIIGTVIPEAFVARWDRLSKTPRHELFRQLLCDDFHSLLRSFSSLITPILEGAESKNIPVEIEPVIQRVVNEIYSDDFHCSVLYSTHALNYSISSVRAFIAEWSKYISGIPVSDLAGELDNFVLVSIPRLERDSSALHTIILGHEFGHLRDSATDISADFEVPPVKSPQGGSPKLTPAEQKQYTRMASNWASEFVADIFAALLIGPASLFALIELSIAIGGLKADSFTHPATDRRIRVIQRVLNGNGFEDVGAVAKVNASLKVELADSLKRRGSIEGEDGRVPSLVWNTLSPTLRELINRCEAVLESNEIFRADRWAEVSDAVALLRRGIPCGELPYEDGGAVGSIVGNRAVLNAAWVVRLEHLEDIGKELGLDHRDIATLPTITETIDQLLLKSFEVRSRRDATPWE